MSLPKIKHPLYTITIPSTKQEIQIRPFTVQEEKLLLMAKASEKIEDVINSINQIVRNCIVTPVNIDALATFDVEYIFVKLRAKSIGEIVELQYDEGDEKINFKVNLDEIKVHFNPEHTNKIHVYDKIYFKMKYPTLNDMKEVQEGIDESNVLKILYKCIDTIYDDDNVYSEYTEKELEEFINSLPLDSINNLTKFFDTMPSLEHKVTLKNKAGEKKEVLLKGINNFFTF